MPSPSSSSVSQSKSSRKTRSSRALFRLATFLSIVIQAEYFFSPSRSGAEAKFLNVFASQSQQSSDPCYDEIGNAKRCIPNFVNAAFGREVKVSECYESQDSRFDLSRLPEQ